MKAPIALVDCNHFYASCERVFRPHLHGLPVVVLSNNDGCVIARSKEAIELGIPMGLPAHHIAPETGRHGLELCSSNYELYGDMSARVLATLRTFTPLVEPYSIDESWLGFEGFDTEALAAHCQNLRRTVHRWTGLPVSVGIAPTRTLAKLANRHAKQHPATEGVVMLKDAEHAQTQALLARTPVGHVWGVGARVAVRLQALGIDTALALAQAPPSWIRQQFSVVLERTVRELCGIRCLDMNESPDSRRMIMTSRSFGKMTSSRRDIEEAIRAHASRSAQRLRAQRSLAGAVMVMLRTNPHMPHLAQDHDRLVLPLPRPTDNTLEIVATARKALAQLWKPQRMLYQKCGVQLMDLVDVDGQQLDVFQTPQSEAERARSDHLMATLDQLNKRFGRHAVTVGVQRQDADWQLRCAHRSNRWTTRWEELPTARLT